jgi:mono/diheme cytochrome c family protein
VAGAGGDVLERSSYLMNGIVACGNCHTPQGPNGPLPGMELAGGLVIQEEAFTVHTPNITPDKETGIGASTDQQIVTAIREGRRPAGRIIGPPMPIGLYRKMSDRDVRALVADLRQVKPVHNQVPPSEYHIPLPTSYGPPVGSVPDVPRDDPVTSGAYLAGPLGHCIECHTPMVEGRPAFAHRLGAGGNPFYGPWGISVSRNITPTRRPGSVTGPTSRSSARSPRASAPTVRRSHRRWVTTTTPTLPTLTSTRCLPICAR